MSERNYWLGFAMCYGIGPAKFQTLLASFETAENAWKASEKELQKSVGKAATARILNHRDAFAIEAYVEKLHKKAVDFLTFADPDYPKLLSQIDKPPYVLFIKGNKALLKDACLAVVGTRKITDYGREITTSLTSELAAAGYVIVSGLALGVDAIAHRAALEVGGKTIAVLGVDFMSENVRAILDRAGFGKVIGISFYIEMNFEPILQNLLDFPANFKTDNRLFYMVGWGI